MTTIVQTRATPLRAEGGFTLIELMVALTLSMVLVVAMLKAQTSLATQTVLNSDAAVRDNESRNAADAITRTVSGAGFLLGGAPYACNEMFTYNSGAASSSLYFTHHPVDAVAASSGLYLQPASGLQLNYPTSSAIPSDVLMVTTSNNADKFNQALATLVRAEPAPVGATVGTTPSTDAKVPVQNPSGTINSGDIGVFQVTLSSPGLPNRVACFRVPLTLQTAPFNYIQSSASTIMPSTLYAGFATSLATANYPALTDTPMTQLGQFVDLGTTPELSTIVFYIDNSGSFPVLMMGTYKFADDTLDTGNAATNAPLNGTQAVAAGVISLQVRFGVDPGKTGAVTAYESAATVTTNNDWDVIRTTKILIVSRSLIDDNSLPAASQTSSIGICGSGQSTSLLQACIPSGFNFSAITATGFPKRRYTVNTIEIANRNLLWNCDGTICMP